MGLLGRRRHWRRRWQSTQAWCSPAARRQRAQLRPSATSPRCRAPPLPSPPRCAALTGQLCSARRRPAGVLSATAGCGSESGMIWLAQDLLSPLPYSEFLPPPAVTPPPPPHSPHGGALVANLPAQRVPDSQSRRRSLSLSCVRCPAAQPRERRRRCGPRVAVAVAAPHRHRGAGAVEPPPPCHWVAVGADP